MVYICLNIQLQQETFKILLELKIKCFFVQFHGFTISITQCRNMCCGRKSLPSCNVTTIYSNDKKKKPRQIIRQHTDVCHPQVDEGFPRLQQIHEDPETTITAQNNTLGGTR